MKNQKHFLVLALMGTVLIGGCANTAHARPPERGYWRLNPHKCPDLMEDYRERQAMRRDEAVYRGPVDVLEDRLQRREARRDEAVTQCPASAWEWVGPRPRAYWRPRPASVKIYYNPHRHHYYRTGVSGHIVIRF
ncbi:MAG TPA: hypothetical protein ENK01_00685 [Hellea balneolensis]|uniref:Lipoprotein n=1 Tax=Hellea balneolensis TaxID=287478 RepID=A0A7V5NWL6_9PROT|nr:hypothetical protein [Hellea balneolensis]